MLSSALAYAAFAYALAFAIALLTAGLIKLIQIGTSLGGGESSPAEKSGVKLQP